MGTKYKHIICLTWGYRFPYSDSDSCVLFAVYILKAIRNTIEYSKIFILKAILELIVIKLSKALRKIFHKKIVEISSY
ncbi:Uncharacterised protein [Paenibacillus macerans]|uniref:Uncharacterized protein n=1 Tax=Paenibacillus macerans TaxID=44252 RepID=A0A090ZLU4_PAEMA|nr:hypothetical protein DJ90_2056 [Paenibacillus macerans]SUA84439.1 Uncharacterised protein [Paenibacillus macerans]